MWSDQLNTFMEKIGLPIITLTIGSVLSGIIVAAWTGKIQIVNFNWLVLILGCVMFVMLVYFAWYSMRTKKLLVAKHKETVNTLRAEYAGFQERWREYFTQERERLDKDEIGLSQSTTKRLEDGLEEIRRECMEAIADAESRMDSSIKTTQTIFTGAVDSYKYALDSQTLYIFDVMQKKLKELLTTGQVPYEQENVSAPSQETYNGV